jgi:autotransporter passenger strand-loop-strand repeat protein
MIALAARRSSTLRAASAVTVDSSGRLIVPSGGSVGASTVLNGSTENVSAGGTNTVTAAIASGGMLETLRHRHHERHGRQLRHLIASDRAPCYRVHITLKRPFRGDP